MTEEKKTVPRPLKPAVWEHKTTKKQVRVMPWWEHAPNTEITDKDIKIPEMNREWKWGMLVQVGWLIENEHGVFLGVGPTAKESFNVISEGSYE